MTRSPVIHVEVSTFKDGWRRVAIRCACASVGRVLTSWEPVEPVLSELKAEHRKTALFCRCRIKETP